MIYHMLIRFDRPPAGRRQRNSAQRRRPPDITKIRLDVDAKMAKNDSFERLPQCRSTRPRTERQGRAARGGEDQGMSAPAGSGSIGLDRAGAEHQGWDVERQDDQRQQRPLASSAEGQ